jgi:membrane protein YqaA with SNARE-associated domain
MTGAIVLTTGKEIVKIAIECGIIGTLIGGFIGYTLGKDTGEKLHKQMENKVEVAKDSKV